MEWRKSGSFLRTDGKNGHASICAHSPVKYTTVVTLFSPIFTTSVGAKAWAEQHLEEPDTDDE